MNFATVRYGKMVAVANFKTESTVYRVRDVCIVRTGILLDNASR